MQIVLNWTTNTSNQSFEEVESTLTFSLVFLSLILSCFCVITVFGNALVIYAVIQERYLKSGNFIAKKKRTIHSFRQKMFYFD